MADERSPEGSPDPSADSSKRKRNRKKRRAQHNPFVVGMSLLMTLAVIGVVGGSLLFFTMFQRFTEPGPSTDIQTVLIPPGSSQARITTLLTDAGVISDEWVFKTGVQLFGEESNLKAGEYAFEPGVSMMEVMNQIVAGRSIQHKVTVPEGFSTTQAIDRVRSHEVLMGEIGEIPPEGSLLPETYVFTRGTTRQELVDRMREAHNVALAEIWANRDPDIPVSTPEELVILASIVEKETAVAAERPEVAGVFVNRLRVGQKLESDPTILYGLYKGEAWTRPRTIYRSELDAPNNPYNTYQIPGLPPGPIANPGRESMAAVANPAEHEFFFFVADGTGGHAFARTFDEHLDNVARWREIERQRANGASESGITDIAPDSSGN